MVKNSLCAALESIEGFQSRHWDWPFVRRETEMLKARLEDVLLGLENMIKDMEIEEAPEVK